MSDDQSKKSVEYLLHVMDIQGVACSSVKDGHVLAFKTTWLRELLEKFGDKKEISIFIKRPDVKEAN
jgi:hypothetical protein